VVVVVQSQINVEVARAALRYLEVPVECVLGLGNRGVQLGWPYRTVPLESVGTIAFTHNPWVNWRSRRSVARSLQREVDARRFDLFVPGLLPRQYLALACLRACASVSLIEEGVGVLTDDSIRTRPLGGGGKLAKRLLYGPPGRFDGQPAGDLVDRAFAMSPAAYPWIDPGRRTVVMPEFMRAERGPARTDTIVLVIERLTEEGLVDEDHYLGLLAEVIDELPGRGLTSVMVKFPPQGATSVRDGVHRLLRPLGESVTELEPSTCLEELAWVHRPTFVAVTSSVLYYAASFGAPAFTLWRRLHDERLEPVVREVEVFFDGLVEHW
jgi:hypothetical protein